MTKAISGRYLFGAVTYKRVGEFAKMDLFGAAVYKRAGRARWLLGITWRSK